MKSTAASKTSKASAKKISKGIGGSVAKPSKKVIGGSVGSVAAVSIMGVPAFVAPVGSHDPEYDAFLAKVTARFKANAKDQPLFMTDPCVDFRIPTFALPRDSKTGAPGRVIRGLFAAYLGALPTEHRQHHTCRACEQFFNRYGALVTIDDAGRQHSALWNEDDAPAFYKPAVRAVLSWLGRVPVTGVFLASEKTLGTPATGPWHHFAVTNPTPFKHALLNASQKAAEKLQDYETIQRALDEFTLPQLDQALTLLRSEQLYRSEKVLGQAEWLRNLLAARGMRSNVVWKAVATAPAGFCHPRSSMIGTLLEDIASGMDFATVSKRFAEKMHPLQYQRPQAAPSAGAIAAAEKTIAALGAAGSLKRRFARIDEIETLWRPREIKGEKRDGVFGHLVARGTTPGAQMTTPPIVMTWDKFSKTVLPIADKIEFFAQNLRDNYSAILTAVDPNAPAILQWDADEARNPFSWYVYMGGSIPSHFNLTQNVWHTVTAVAMQPSMWGGKKLAHQGESVFFILDGAKDTLYERAGNALFPEIMKEEYRAMRSVIEAYSRREKIEGYDEASACGIRLQKGQGNWNNLFRVTVGGSVSTYKLDRWD